MKYVVLLLLFVPFNCFNVGLKYFKQKDSKKITYVINNNFDKLLNYIKKHEGFRAKPYTCTGGQLTIGYGTSVRNYKLFMKEIPANIDTVKAEKAATNVLTYCFNYVKSNTNNITNNQLLAFTHLAYCVGTNHKGFNKLLKQHNNNKLNYKDWLLIGGEIGFNLRLKEIILYNNGNF